MTAPEQPNGGGDYRTITIKTLDGSTLQGRIFLATGQRVSDVFTRSEAPFLVLVDVILREGSGKTLIVNKDHIVWVEPEDAE